jgi:shikimate dehydrogenase
VRITGTIEVLFTIGDAVAQVWAPDLFNRVLAAGGVDAVVVPARVASAHVDAFVRATLASPTVRGLCVAILHKAPPLDVGRRRELAADIILSYVRARA